ILTDLIKQNQLDLSTLKQDEVEHLFRDKKVQNQLMNAFLASPPEGALWHATLLKQLHYPDLDTYLIQRIEEMDAKHQVSLLNLLSNDPPEPIIARLQQLAVTQDSAVAVTILQVVNRLSPMQKSRFDLKSFLDHPSHEARAYAASALYQSVPDECRHLITNWISSCQEDEQKAGIIAAGASGQPEFEKALREAIALAQSPEILAAALKSLHALDLHDLNDVVTPFLTHSDSRVRLAAMSAYHVTDKASLNTAIRQLADDDAKIRQAAKQRILRASYVDGKALIKAMDHPNRYLREHILQLLDQLQIKDLDLYRFASDQLEGAYKYLNESSGIAALPENAARDLLLDHLHEQRNAIVQRVLRVLVIQDQSGRLQVICRGLLAKDQRQNANSQEALDDLLDKKLSRVLIPLLEEDAPAQAREAGKRYYGLSDFQGDKKALMNHLLTRRDDWISILMTLYLLENNPGLAVDMPMVKNSMHHSNPHIRTMAQKVAAKRSGFNPEEDTPMDVTLALPDIILKLKPIEIFEDLNVNELAAVASVLEEVAFSANEIVIQEGDPGDTLFLIIEGEVAVLKTETDGSELTLDHIQEGDHFGEMALFEDIPRTASIRTLKPSRMLMLHKQAFNEMVREYPQIALKICRVFSGRIRKLHQKISDIEKASHNAQA
ncbi:MAG: cyclic nucleotide-binding domain-containing protein, partial [Desulfobacteraceae bacterium]